jgi:Uma2 family endonuclease
VNRAKALFAASFGWQTVEATMPYERDELTEQAKPIRPRRKRTLRDDEYPDGERSLPEGGIHFNAIALLSDLFQANLSPEWFFALDLFWYYEENNIRAVICPDAMLARGPGRMVLDKYLQWKYGAPICFVIEVLSKSSRKQDLVHKCKRYRELGVQEYFLFDPRNLTKAGTTSGFHLLNREYVPAPASPHGGVVSNILNASFACEEMLPRFYDLTTGQPWLTRYEKEQKAREAEQKAREAEQKAREAEQGLRAAAEQELERLRALLREKGIV